MSLGLFLDVDNTITEGFIQEHYAKLLGVEKEYSEIEKKFQSQAISSDEFGRQLVRLFASRDFTAKYAEDHFDAIPLQPWAEDLLGLQVEKYLVSSGPSYYVYFLADRYKLSHDNVLCSIYKFNEKTGIISSCAAVDQQRKRQFVEDHRARHVFTVGVGDNKRQDDAFIGTCTLGILTTPDDTHFSVQSHQTLYNFLLRMCKIPMFRTKTRPEVFIASSTEAMPLAKRLHEALAEVSTPYLWSEHTFHQPGQSYIEALEHEIAARDFALLLLTPDDQVTSRDRTLPASRDNLVLELGMGLGAMGRDRTFGLIPKGKPLKIPSDLSGVIFLEYDADKADVQFEAAFAHPIRQIVDQIKRLGPRT